MFEISWEQRLSALLSDINAALDFIDQCNKPENIALAEQNNTLSDAYKRLENSARKLKQFTSCTMADSITEYYTDRTERSWHGH